MTSGPVAPGQPVSPSPDWTHPKQPSADPIEPPEPADPRPAWERIAYTWLAREVDRGHQVDPAALAAEVSVTPRLAGDLARELRDGTSLDPAEVARQVGVGRTYASQTLAALRGGKLTNTERIEQLWRLVEAEGGQRLEAPAVARMLGLREGRLAWMDQAACKGMDTDRFFPDPGEGRKAAEAKAICADCQVQDRCTELAVRGADSQDTDHGIFGGTLPTERGGLRPNRFPEPSAYRQRRELAEQAHELASRVGLRQAATQLGVSRDTLKGAWAYWNMAQPERKVGHQPSRFLADRAEAERAFRLAEQLGSVNAAAGQLGTTWPSLRKAFQRHELGTPQPNPAAVNQRKSAVQLARRGGQQPMAPELDPEFVQLNPGTVPRARGHSGTSAVRLRRAEEIEMLGFGVVADMNRESRSQRGSVRHRAVQRRAERAQQLLAERASGPARRQAERAQRPARTRIERAERSGRPHHPYRDER
jgi:WhiB family transcriptional regulator, redox-sensing transcriptional regulator